LVRGLARSLAIAGIVGASLLSSAQQPQAPAEDFVKAHYTKYEFRVPMRDGKRLFTAVYVPKATAFEDHGPYPFLMDRTPYSVGPYGEDNYPQHVGPSDEFEKGGYIFVYQDVRGRFMSEGTFVEMTPHIDEKKSPRDVDDASDTYDTIEFLLKNVSNNNGKVGIWGISYPGFYTSASMIDSHPALVAASPQAPMTDLFLGDDSYHGGAFMLSAGYGFYAPFFHPQNEPQTPKPGMPFEFGTPDSYEFYLKAGNLANLDKFLKEPNFLWDDQVKHDTYDSYWQSRDLSRHMKNVKCAVLVVGGWFDAEDLSGPHRTFDAVSKFNPETQATLVEGPWVHGGWSRGEGNRLGDIDFNAKTAEYFRANVQFPFFEHYLKGKSAGAQPRVVVFETGADVWRHFDEWPPKAAKAKTFYFHAGGKLSFDPPAEASSVDEYVSDPNHPVPFVGYTTDTVPQRYMVDDQRFASYRPDVLVYETDPLTEDVTIAGPISPKLKVASSGTDSDFVVKLIDVYPNDYGEGEGRPNKRVMDGPPVHMGGYQEMLRGEPFRAKFRNSWQKPEPLTPGKQTAINFTMPDLFHTFRAGHRIMVQVQSSWFPLTDRNPQTFTDIPTAKPEDFKKATEQVFHQKDAASGVEVLVLPAM
jgi:hypothetical protein